MAEDLPLAIKRFVDMYVEVLNQRRPLRHLLPYASDQTFGSIRVGLVRRGGTWWPVGRRPPRRIQRQTTRTTGTLRGMPIRVQRLRSSAPQPGVAEVAAVLRRGDEVRAVALRLELEHRRWVCTALEFIG